MTPPITDHVHRPAAYEAKPQARLLCGWLGTCQRPPEDHITTPDYRAAREGTDDQR